MRENPAQIEAIRILLDRPQDWSTDASSELRTEAGRSAAALHASTICRRLTRSAYHKALVDIISMVKHAANEEEPLLTAAERVERAFAKITAGQTVHAENSSSGWTASGRTCVENLSIDREDFDVDAGLHLARAAGVERIAVFRRSNCRRLIINELNEAMAA